VLVFAEAAPVAHHYTAWEHLGYALLVSGALFLIACYWVGFRMKAKCLVVGSTTNRPCDRDGNVVLGCWQHRWQKPVAWIRHLGAARWLDPWLYRLHKVPYSFMPMPMPVIKAGRAGNLLTVAALAQPPAQSGRMSKELKVASWSLVCAVVQAATGIVTLGIAA
jgi:hypothetical protein